ncbi:MAG: sigma-70 family RNA polymerase sigma factor [Planctomycetes bacterium]|nr:sigma-70 family RNA polymerase sigma factor [Planctomycetota bacterium]MCB9872215.1 sigma-70 family RNA polymerase sigma factor [Planctomycetota bacterium]
MSPSPDSLPTLMRRWHDGDEQALSELMERVIPWLRDYVSGQLGAPLRGKLESQDVVQDAVANFLRYSPRFVVENDAQLGALIRQIVNNVIRGHHRYFHRKRRELAVERPLSGVTSALFDAVTPSQAMLEDDREARVRMALELLGEVEQRVICMRVYDGCSFRDIADQLGFTEEATRKRFARALRKLEDKVRRLEANDVWGFLAT